MTIPNVNPYTGNKPTPGQPQPEFNQNMSDELDYFNSLPEELNPAIDGINATATQVTNDAASAAQSATAAEAAAENSGYAGLWPDTGGSAIKGETWQTQIDGEPTGRYFTALKNTTIAPISDDVNWRGSFSYRSLGEVINYEAASIADMISGIGGAVDVLPGQIWSCASGYVEGDSDGGVYRIYSTQQSPDDIEVGSLFASLLYRYENTKVKRSNLGNFNLDPSKKDYLTTALLGAVGEHRHFGSITRDNDGVIYISYRKADTHVISDNSAGYFISSSDGGKSWSSEKIITPGEAGYDVREHTIFASDSGKLICAYTIVKTDSTEVRFEVVESYDKGDTWVNKQVIGTYTDGYPRVFGQMKYIDGPTGNKRIIQSAYDKDGSNWYVVYFTSDDDGATWTRNILAALPISSGNNYNEVAIDFFNRDRGIAVARDNSGPLRYWLTSDGGATWVDSGTVTNSESGDVAPSLNITYPNGVPAVILGYCSRTNDETRWTWDTEENLFGGVTTSVSFPRFYASGVNDMIQASGYQSAILDDNGTLMYVEFKEYDGPGFPTNRTDIRVGLITSKWANTRDDSVKIRGRATRLSNALESSEVLGETSPAYATNSNSLLGRIHYGTFYNDAVTGGLGTYEGQTALFDNNRIARLLIRASGGKAWAVRGLDTGTDTEMPPSQRTGLNNAPVTSASVPAHTTYAGTTAAREHFTFLNPNGNVGGIITDGTTTTFKTTSDPRVKSEFREMSETEIAEVISNIAETVGAFRFLADESKEVAGFNAHKAIDIIGMGSEIGVEGNGPRNANIGDVYGTEIIEGEEVELRVTPAGVDQSKAVPYLVLAVKMLIDKVNNLEGR